MPADEEKEHVQSLEKKSPVPGKSRFYFACSLEKRFYSTISTN